MWLTIEAASEMFSCWSVSQPSSCAPHFQSLPGAHGRVDLMSHQKVASFNTILHCRFLCQQKTEIESKRCSQTCDLVLHKRKTHPLHLIYWICPLKKKSPEFRQSSLCSPSATGINIWLLRDETVHTADSELKIHMAGCDSGQCSRAAGHRENDPYPGLQEWEMEEKAAFPCIILKLGNCSEGVSQETGFVNPRITIMIF